ncbi:FAD-dependent oxidoreductase [Hymenobacter sp. 15J16-1T3B]|uniref:FAD-dependent oxidoreductase n=1 Tax=Hymenobacter sp. 15J16-1T3B TaxID=2886941 RepID=UPI001D12A6FA|nr:FAD-dependent oxidoreductase [Hymenobacter sp. 15J16-1T3B]MCC3155916.1 FAD-dependent oxidoreductase [Hymenobacter sp. 15J16-1T3B]
MPNAPEFDLAPADALQEGELKAFPAADTEVLLVRRGGRYHAFAAHCPHYGAPLAKGKMVGERLVCPWHHACFRVPDGHLCEPPALDDLPAYPVREADGRVWVTLPPAVPQVPESPDATPTAETGGAAPALRQGNPTDASVFVIVGAGAAGQMAAQTLRTEGFAGRVVLIGAEAEPPYDRTKLSKAYLAGKTDDAHLPLRYRSFYRDFRIEHLPEARIGGLNTATRELLFADDRAPLHYDALLLCPGSAPRTLPATVPGHDLPGVLVLRSHADARRLRDAVAEARHVVVIGGSFIGMEAAASLAGGADRSVTVVASQAEPFEKVLGPRIGAMFRQLHAQHGISFRGGQAVTALGTGPTGKLASVTLQSGDTLPADLVVLGIGVQPATDFLREALPREKDGGLAVDAHLRVAEGIWAAGDVATFELPPAAGGRTRIEHWRVAQQQGRVAALNMLGRATRFEQVPFFWTQQFGKSLRYAGHAQHWDDIIYHGEVEQQDFLALYVDGGRIVAAAAMNRDADMICIEALLALNQMPAPAAARPEIDWAELLAQAQTNH